MLFNWPGNAILPNEREFWTHQQRKNAIGNSKKINKNQALCLFLPDRSMKSLPASLIISTSARCGGSAVVICLWSGGSFVP